MKSTKNLKLILYVGLFALICIGTLSFLNLCTQPSSPILDYVEWETVQITGDGGTRSYDPYAVTPDDWQEGETILLTGRLPEAADMPELYEDTGYLRMSYGIVDLTVRIDGRERLHLSTSQDKQDSIGFFSNVQISLFPEDAGKEISLEYIPLAADVNSFMYPLLTSYSNVETDTLSYYSAAASDTLSAGAYALSFVLICAVFLISLNVKTPDWSLPVLAMAAFFTMLIRLNNSFGFYIFPEELYEWLSSAWIYLIPIGLTVLYLFLSRRSSFPRYLIRVTACTVLVFTVWYVVDRFQNGYFSRIAYDTLETLLHGAPRRALFFLNVYLTTACAGIACYSLVRAQIRVRAQARAIALHNRLVTESYRQMEQTLRSTSLMRHEWKNQVAALHLLAVQKNYAELERTLKQLDGSMDQMSTQRYSANLTVNVILQNVAAKASDLGIDFHASAPLPETLKIDVSDLCSLLINMLDNALEAASGAEGAKEIDVSIKISQGFLAVKCENTYSGPLAADESGQLQSTKSDPEYHGIGIAQMQNVVKKYNGMLDISHTDDRFTVAAALGI